jgi:hypothetical protein
MKSVSDTENFFGGFSMKKALLVLLVFCLVAGAVAAQTFGTVRQIVLTDNFQYGFGYQAQLTSADLMNGYRLQRGDTFTLRITYTASRDLEGPIGVGFVDTSQGGNWWTPLSYNQRRPQDIPDALIPASKAGEVVTAELTITLLRNPTSAGAAANALVFDTSGQGRNGTAGSGVQGPVTLNVTNFVLTKN